MSWKSEHWGTFYPLKGIVYSHFYPHGETTALMLRCYLAIVLFKSTCDVQLSVMVSLARMCQNRESSKKLRISV